MEKEKKMAREYSFKKESSFIRGSFMREKETGSAYWKRIVVAKKSVYIGQFVDGKEYG